MNLKILEQASHKINERKCHKITFNRSSNELETEYNIGELVIRQVNAVRDLGVILDAKWTFDKHLDSIIAKSYKTLGFIKRLTFGFSSVETIVYLFRALVMPGLNLPQRYGLHTLKRNMQF